MYVQDHFSHFYGRVAPDGDLRRNRSGGETGLCVYIAMIYVGRMQ